MPNWCENRLKIETNTKEDAEILISAFRNNEDNKVFSFNSIIPRPKKLDILEGSVTVRAQKYLEEKKLAKNDKQLKELEKKWREEMKDANCDEFGEEDEDYKFGKGYEAFLKYSDAVAKNLAEYGYPTWYNWSLANWGVKWDASSPELTKRGEKNLIFEFSTPWAPPIPVFEFIAKKFDQNIKFMSVESIEEGNDIFFNEVYVDK